MTRIVRGAALHVSRGEQTLLHSHYAWKVHVGLDAPVWLESASLVLSRVEGIHAVIVPPGLEHRVGSFGLSLTILVAPGSHSTMWRASGAALVHEGTTAAQIKSTCKSWQFEARGDTDAFISEVLGLALPPSGAVPHVDVRARRALTRLNRRPDTPLDQIARSERMSLDRLSHLVVQDTGMTLRRHNLWSRLMALLSSNKKFSNVAAAAAESGFADHAHLTRTYRAMLGRLPSEFAGPPDAIEPWGCF